MAIQAALFFSDGYLALDLYPDEQRERVEDSPDAPDFPADTPLWLFWDGQKLDNGEREFVGVAVRNIALLEERDLELLDRLSLPRVDCLEAGLYGATVPAVLRWARQRYPGQPVAYRATSTG